MWELTLSHEKLRTPIHPQSIGVHAITPSGLEFGVAMRVRSKGVVCFSRPRQTTRLHST